MDWGGSGDQYDLMGGRWGQVGKPGCVGPMGDLPDLDGSRKASHGGLTFVFIQGGETWLARLCGSDG